MASQFIGTSAPKGPYSAKTGDNDCNINSSRYSLRTALCDKYLGNVGRVHDLVQTHHWRRITGAAICETISQLIRERTQ